jgi:hypothetical protein
VGKGSREAAGSKLSAAARPHIAAA